MSRNAALGFLAAGAVMGVLAVRTIVIGDGNAAPFNAVVTKRADAGVVTSFCIYRQELPDGGATAYFTSTMSLPEVRTLPDGGTRTVPLMLNSDNCTLAAGALTQANNFANGPAATCVRASNDLEL